MTTTVDEPDERTFPLGPEASLPARLLGELLALAYACWGLLAMRWVGFGVPVVATLGVGTAATAVLALVRPEHRLVRMVTVAGAMVAIAATGAAFAGVWIGVGLVLADVVIRGGSGWPGLSGADPTMVIPVTVLMALAGWRADETSYRIGPTPFIVSFGLAAMAAVSFPGPWRRHIAWVCGLGALFAVCAFAGNNYNLALAVIPLLASATALVWWSAHLDPDGRCAPWRSVGPMVLAAPALVWWMVNVALTAVGEWTTPRHLYGAWFATVSRLPNGFNDVNAYTGIPTVVVALVVSGAFIAVLGRRGVLAIAAGVGLGTAVAVAIATTWQVGMPR